MARFEQRTGAKRKRNTQLTKRQSGLSLHLCQQTARLRAFVRRPLTLWPLRLVLFLNFFLQLAQDRTTLDWQDWLRNILQDDICLILEIEQTWISDTRGCPGSSISFPPPQCAPSNLGFHQDHLLLLGLLLLGEDEGHTKSILPSKKQCQPKH